MKYFWIFILYIGNLKSFAQTDTLHLYQLYSSFSDVEKSEWTTFQNNWQFVHYKAIQSKHHIKALNCKNCESFYADIYLEINEQGKINNTQIKTLKKCGLLCNDSLLLNDYIKSLLPYDFKFLHGKKFIARFGNVLKC